MDHIATVKFIVGMRLFLAISDAGCFGWSRRRRSSDVVCYVVARGHVLNFSARLDLFAQTA